MKKGHISLFTLSGDTVARTQSVDLPNDKAVDELTKLALNYVSVARSRGCFVMIDITGNQVMVPNFEDKDMYLMVIIAEDLE